MAWSTRFLAELAARRREPRFVVESLTWLPTTATSIYWSSHGIAGYQQVITRAGSSINHGTLNLAAATTSPTTLSIGLARTVDLSRLRPGMLVQMRIGFTGWTLDEYEPVFVGMLASVRRSGRSWVADFTGLDGALHGRGPSILSNGSSDARLFAEAGQYTELVTDYTVGDSTLELDYGSVVAASSDGLYAVRVTPDSGEPFILTATALAPGDVLTGVSSTGQVGTTAANASGGNAVQGLAYDDRHPLQMAMRLVTSTGDGDNGLEDVYPESWGLGIPADVVDLVDYAEQRGTSLPSTGHRAWKMLADAPSDAPASWIASWLADGGFFLAQHQGRLTGRAIHRPQSRPIKAWVSDRDIIAMDYDAFGSGAETRQFWTTDQGGNRPTQEYSAAQYDGAYPPGLQSLMLALTGKLPPAPVIQGSSSLKSTLNAWSLPMRGRSELALPVYGTVPEKQAWTVDVFERLYRAQTRRTESYRVRLAGLHHGVATLGDDVGLVTFDLDSRRGPSDLSSKGGWHTVVGGGPNWFEGTTSFDLAYVHTGETG
jgi:hypothetical protein